MSSWAAVCEAKCPVEPEPASNLSEAPEWKPDEGAASLAEVRGCENTDSFCSIYLDSCTSEAAQSTCTQTCCGLLRDPIYGNSWEADQKRGLKAKMQEMS